MPALSPGGIRLRREPADESTVKAFSWPVALAAFFLSSLTVSVRANRFQPLVGFRMAPEVTAQVSPPLPSSARPTPELPRVWDLPEGWWSAVRKLPDGGMVEYLSGAEAGVWARFYSWPSPGFRAGPLDARKRFFRDFDMKLAPQGVRVRGREHHLSFGTWSQKDAEGLPDVLVQVRLGNQGSRLYAVVVGIPFLGRSPARIREAEIFAQRLSVIEADYPRRGF